jgi:phosphatidylinositol alpha-mannosyltransferase
MKIGLVCPYNMFEHAGGVQQLVMHLADGLRQRDHEVKIITPKPAGFKEEAPPNYIFLGVSRRIRSGLSTMGDIGFENDGAEIDAVLKREKFDVINFHEPWAPVLTRQIVTRSSEAHVGTFHANLNDSVAAKSIVNMFVPYGRGIGEKMHLLTAPSPAAAAVLVDKGAGNGLVENIKYVPNGIDLKLYKPPKKKLPLNGPDTKTIVFVGRLEKRKGVDDLLKAFSVLTREMPHVYLMIAGKGNRRYRLEQQVKTMELPNVNFLGYVTDEQKRHLMGNADVVCAPAMFGESFGIVLLEAMAMGTPLIAGNNIGYRSVMIGQGRLGLIDAEATEDFANRLSVFLEDAATQKLVRGWGLKEVKKYDYPKIVDLYESAYKEALAILNEARTGKAAQENARANKKIVSRLFVRRHAR